MVIFLLLLFWFICSGKISLFFVLASVVSLFISLYTYKKLSFSLTDVQIIKRIRFFKLLKEMFISSVEVTKIIWFANKKVKPICRVIKAESLDKNQQVIQANWITLTPGTMTLNLQDDKILVHAINQEMLEDNEEQK